MINLDQLKAKLENPENPLVQLRGHLPTSKKKILIIDDNAEQLYLVEEILALGDYETVTASSGEEALYFLSEFDELNLILLDMKMPDMSGHEFLLLLEEKLPEIIKTIPIVFLTAMDKVPLSKAVGFIRKPFEFDNFLKAVGRFIETGIGSG